MAERFMDRLEHAWDVFRGRDNREPKDPAGSGSSHFRPERGRRTLYNYNGIIVPILTQIAVDAAGVELRHVRVDKDGKYEEDIESALSHTMNVWPNLDQAPTMFRQDIIMTMLQEGHVVAVPVETSANPDTTGSYSIHNMRAGVVRQWWANDVRVDLYDERTGLHMEVLLPKKQVAIVENPLYSIMNEPNSTLQRLIHKLAQLDITDDRMDALMREAEEEGRVTAEDDGSGYLLMKSGDSVHFSGSMKVTCTAYTAGYGGVGTRTATGTTVHVGTVAVDKKVIPLGTEMFIVGSSGYTYGNAVAEDTGVRGAAIDLYMNSYQECKQFGRQKNSTVYFLD